MRSLALAIVTIFMSVAYGQTVQLPTLRTFGVQTTVSVPDGGTAYLGGVNSARTGTATRGVPALSKLPGPGRLFNNQVSGYNLGSNQAFVRAQIIDLREMDRAVLNAARARRGGASATNANAEFLTQYMGRSQARTRTYRPEPAPTPVPVKSTDDQTQRLLDLGDRALSAGNYELATKYYAAAEQRTLPTWRRSR